MHIQKNSTVFGLWIRYFRHRGWFLVMENRWLDRLKILSWHPSLARHKGRTEYLLPSTSEGANRPLVNPGQPPDCSNARPPPSPIGSDPDRDEADLGPQALGRVVGELAVRESLSRVWTGSPQSLEYILDALITIEEEDKPQAMNFQLVAPHLSPQKLSLQ